MKHLWVLLIAFLCSCSGYADDGIIDDGTADYDGDEVELGTTSEALTFQCKSSAQHYFGVDTTTWNAAQCNNQSSSAICAFPSVASGFGMNPKHILLRNGWTTTEKFNIGIGGAAAAKFFNDTFGGCLKLIGNQTDNFKFHTSAQSGVFYDVVIDKGAIPNFPLSPGFNSEDSSRIIHTACISSLGDIQESYPMQRAVTCGQWGVTFDYDKFKAWASAGPTGQDAPGNRNIMQMVYARAIGLGSTTTSQTLGVTDLLVRRDVVQTQWKTTGGTSQLDWVCNASNNYESISTPLNCL